MTRSLKKGPYLNERLMKKLRALRPGDKTIIKVWDRACTIAPEMVGFTIGVHNGKQHTPVFIVENMVGHKLGEFSPTRKFVSHGGKMAKDQAKGAVAPAAPASVSKVGK
ncbi:MAG: 30S ribosomal protein S19 [bacterium]|nr:30S ribosomal protein S19 [bacterium]